MYFNATGGQPAYVFALEANPSGGNIDPVTGLYQAGQTDGVTDIVRVTDQNGEGDSTQTFVHVVEEMIVFDQSQWTVKSVSSEETSAEDAKAKNAFDGDPDTIWHSEYSSTSAEYPHEIQINLGEIYEIDGFRYLSRQDVRRSRPEMYEFYVSKDGVAWGDPVATGFFPPYDFSEQEIFFHRVTGQYIKFVLLSPLNNGEPWVAVAELNVIGAQFFVNYAPDVVIDTPGTNLTINVGQEVNFSATAMDIDGPFPLDYLWDFKDPEVTGVQLDVDDPGNVTFSTPGTYVVTLTVTDGLGRASIATRVIKVLNGGDSLIPHDTWEVAWVDSEESWVGEPALATNAFDGNVNTYWHTEWRDAQPEHPHEMIIDLGSAYLLDGFRYLPRQSKSFGRIGKYHVYVSADGQNWGTAVMSGTFPNSSAWQAFLFAPKWGRFVRLVALTEVSGNPWTAVAELEVEGACKTPFVKLIYPQTGQIMQGPDLTVKAGVCLNSSMFDDLGVINLGVKFKVDGGSTYEHVIWLPNDDVIEASTFEYTFSGVEWGTHFVEACIVDQNGNSIDGDTTYDIANSVAVGEYYVAVGDSITAGLNDDFPFDDVSQDNRNAGGGFAPVLNDLLTALRLRQHTVISDGIVGGRTYGGPERMRKTMLRNPNAGYYIISLGANDYIANPNFPLPSGLGTLPPQPGSYKDYIQQMIDMVTITGKQVYLGDITYTSIYPDRDVDHQEYNAVLEELRITNGLLPLPGMYTYFKNNPDELIDGLHPSGQGYQSMANLWFMAITQPVADDDTATTDEETLVNINVVANDSDPDGTIDETTVFIVTGPDYGTAIANADGTVDYTPDAGFTGSDSFTYTVDDDEGNTSNEATVTVTVSGTQPVADDDTATTDEETLVNINVVANDSDPDGTIDETTVFIVTGPDYGTAIANADGTVDYTPDAGFTGSDSFTYTVDDDEGNTSNETTVTVTVNSI